MLYFKISTDPVVLKIRHSHRFVAGVIQFLTPFIFWSMAAMLGNSAVVMRTRHAEYR